MNCVLYSNSFEGPNRNVVICLNISRSVFHIFRLGNIVLGNIFSYQQLEFIVVYPYSFIQRVMDNLYGPLLWCVHLLYFWSLTVPIPVLFYCMEIISGVLVHTSSCNRNANKKYKKIIMKYNCTITQKPHVTRSSTENQCQGFEFLHDCYAVA